MLFCATTIEELVQSGERKGAQDDMNQAAMYRIRKRANYAFQLVSPYRRARGDRRSLRIRHSL